MSHWYSAMFPEADNEAELMSIYSLHAILGDWEIQTAVKTFRIRYISEPNIFHLFWNDDTFAICSTNSVYAAIRSVAQKQTGVEAWDNSVEIDE
jgi:hypothetical protein